MARRLNLRHAGTIAARELLDVRRDRGTLITVAFFVLAMPVVLVLTSIRPAAQELAKTGNADAREALGLLLPVFMMQVGFMPLFVGVNVAATAFAGERENNTLGPLIATPIAAEAIFVGKLIAAAVPALAASLIAQGAYLASAAIFAGRDVLREMPVGLALVMGLLVVLSLVVLLGVELIVASRVATVRAAQQYGALVSLPLFFGVLFWAFKIRDLGAPLIAATMVLAAVAGVAALFVGAKTWRRDEVIARL